MKTLDSDEIWSHRSLEKSMAHWRTQPLQIVVSLEHRATPLPRPSGVHCTTACQGDASASCSIYPHLSRALLQGSNFACNVLTQTSSLTSVAYVSTVSAACIGSSDIGLTPRFMFTDKCQRRATFLNLAVLEPGTVNWSWCRIVAERSQRSPCISCTSFRTG